MPLEEPLIGTSSWVEHVLSTPPVRALKGPSKPTQYHSTWSDHVGRHVGSQGRNEANCVLLLEYLANIGLIVRYKEQPFRTTLATFGFEIVPDYMAVGSDRKVHLVEAKSARYLTAEVQARFARNRFKFAQFSINYLIWTDRHPFNKHLRHLLLEMRRQTRCVPDQAIRALHLHLAENGPATFQSLVEHGFDQGVVLSAAWKAKCFFDPTQEFRPETVVSLSPNPHITGAFLKSDGEGTGWWNTLPLA